MNNNGLFQILKVKLIYFICEKKYKKWATAISIMKNSEIKILYLIYLQAWQL